MRRAFGETRSAFGMRHARIAADSHERVTLPHWPGCELVHLVAPPLGAQFSLFLAYATDPALIGPPEIGVERFILLRSGATRVTIGGKTEILGDEGYAFLPAGTDHNLALEAGAMLIVLERAFRVVPGKDSPGPVTDRISARKGAALKGDERLIVQKLLPTDAAFDMEINVMTFRPGAGLPYVETHFMEHGLVMLDGGGVYRLEDRWYPVEAGDAIWMGPFCPQWFGAIGRGNARYLIYKDWNRDPLVI